MWRQAAWTHTPAGSFGDVLMRRSNSAPGVYSATLVLAFDQERGWVKVRLPNAGCLA